LDCGELVQVAVDLDARHGRARDGRQQRTTQRVAEGVAKARLQRLDGEQGSTVGDALLRQGRALCNQHFLSFLRTSRYLKVRLRTRIRRARRYSPEGSLLLGRTKSDGLLRIELNN